MSVQSHPTLGWTVSELIGPDSPDPYRPFGTKAEPTQGAQHLRTHIDMTRIGFVGLGNMGCGIFANLCQYAAANRLPPPSAWNVDHSVYSRVQAANPAAKLYTTVEELVSESDVVFSCLLNDAVAEEVYGKMFAALDTSRNVIFVDQSSLKPKTSRKLEAEAKSAGARYLASPVFGRPDAAAAGTLVQVLSGNAAAKAIVMPIIVPAVARRVVDVGDDVAKGSALKLLGNSMILGIIEMLAETHALADSIGFDPEVYQSFIRDFFPLYPFIAYGDNISKTKFNGAGGFRLEAGMKGTQKSRWLADSQMRGTFLPLEKTLASQCSCRQSNSRSSICPGLGSCAATTSTGRPWLWPCARVPACPLSVARLGSRKYAKLIDVAVQTHPEMRKQTRRQFGRVSLTVGGRFGHRDNRFRAAIRGHPSRLFSSSGPTHPNGQLLRQRRGTANSMHAPASTCPQQPLPTRPTMAPTSRSRTTCQPATAPGPSCCGSMAGAC